MGLRAVAIMAFRHSRALFAPMPADPETAGAPTISVVIPVYRASECMAELYRRLTLHLEAIVPSHELVLIEDCGPDDSWNLIRELAARDPRVRGAQLSRNFGQHRAITAGVDLARGDWIVVMDCDLQDRPEEIGRLYACAVEKDFDIVVARRVRRRDPWAKRVTSALFYATFRYLTDLQYDGSVGNFRIISRQVANAFRDMREQMRFFGGIVNWLGFRVGSVDAQHDERFAGSTSYSWAKLVELAVQTIVAHSDKPLRLAIRVGFLLAVTAFIAGLGVIVAALRGQIAVLGWASLMVSIYFMSGVILAFMGMLGLYLGRVFEEVKGRPLYVIREQTFRA